MQRRMKRGGEHPVLHASCIHKSTLRKKRGVNSLTAPFSILFKVVQAARKGEGNSLPALPLKISVFMYVKLTLTIADTVLEKG